MEMVEEVVIVGGGIAGLASALALKRIGVKALVLERSDGLRATGAALSLWRNAWIALESLGVAHKLTSLYPIIQKGYVTNLKTKAVQEISIAGNNGDNGAEPRIVHRKALINALAEELESDSIRFSCKISSIETEEHEGSSIALVRMEDGSFIKAKILIGCDGINSVVAKWLGLAAPVHTGRSTVRGLSVFPQGHGLKPELLQFVGASQRAAFAALNHTDIYWFLTCETPTKGAYLNKDPEEIKREVLENHAMGFPTRFLDVVRHSDMSSLTWAPLMYRKPWRVWPLGTLSRGCVTVCGDAMHPMTPDLGQGGCSALEDAVVLGRHLSRCLPRTTLGVIRLEPISKTLACYVEERRWRAAWLIAASFLSGWVQHGSSFPGVKLFRDFLFYKFLAMRIFRIAHYYDCGKLVD